MSLLLENTATIALLAALLVALLQVVLLGRRLQVVPGLSLVPAACPSVTYLVVVLVLNEEMEDATADFFRVAAEVIPVLLLGLIVEAGALRIRGRGRIDVVANCVTAGYLIAGLGVSLYNVAEDSTKHADIVWASMTAGLAGLLVVAILGLQPKQTAVTDPSEPVARAKGR